MRPSRGVCECICMCVCALQDLSTAGLVMRVCVCARAMRSRHRGVQACVLLLAVVAASSSGLASRLAVGCACYPPPPLPYFLLPLRSGYHEWAVPTIFHPLSLLLFYSGTVSASLFLSLFLSLSFVLSFSCTRFNKKKRITPCGMFLFLFFLYNETSNFSQNKAC